MNNIQTELLDIFKVLEKIIIENNLSYFCSSGTCLGAIRHKGFIPWDDDMDIFMPRDDYETLIKITHKYTGEYFFGTPLDKDYLYPFMKFYSKKYPYVETRCKKKYRKYNYLYIDIFPLDYISDNNVKHNVRKSFILRKILFIKGTISKSKMLNLTKFILAPIIPIRVSSIKKKMNKLGVNTKTNTMMDICWGTKPFRSSYFENYIEVPFENIMVRVPQGYDGYLSAVYGDYMKLPEEKDRRSHELMKLE